MKEQNTPYTASAVVSIFILALLLAVGIYLMINKNVFADQAVLTTVSPNVTVAPSEIASPEIAPTGI